MQKMLVEKEDRLCTRRYELNDYTRRLLGVSSGLKIRECVLTRRQTTTRIAPSGKSHRNYNGFFVYPDDADDLKNHPFFYGIPWDNMQEFTPPFVPRVQSWEDTKYFDDEGPISDIESATSEDSGHAIRLETPLLDPGCHQQESQRIVPEDRNSSVAVQTKTLPPPPYIKSKKPKEKKRPRDKILRDPNCGKVALQMRKDSAFIGYGYSKPKRLSEVIEEALVNEETYDEAAAAFSVGISR